MAVVTKRKMAYFQISPTADRLSLNKLRYIRMYCEEREILRERNKYKYGQGHQKSFEMSEEFCECENGGLITWKMI